MSPRVMMTAAASAIGETHLCLIQHTQGAAVLRNPRTQMLGAHLSGVLGRVHERRTVAHEDGLARVVNNIECSHGYLFLR